jgi:hypothetical protein
MSDEVKIETPVVAEEAVAEVVAPAVDLSAQFADLQRREKAVRTSQSKYKQSLEAEKAKWVEELRSAPVQKLNELGIKADSLAASFLNAPAEPTVEDLTRKELEDLKAWRQQQEDAKNEQVLTDYRKEVFAVVEKGAADEFELINNHSDGKKLYWDTVVAYYQENGEAPDYKDIAKRVEAHLETESKKLLGLKKFAAKPASEPVVEVKKEPTKPSVTLSASLTGQSKPTVKIVENATKYMAGNAFTQFKQEREAELSAKLQKLLLKG